MGDKANVTADAHGCPGCPHPATGPAIQGSPDVFVNGRPALRKDDVGIHAACCGGMMWSASQGAPTVFINGKAAHRLNDQTRHCGGTGQLIEGSSDVIVGDSGGGGGGGGGGGAGGGGGGGAGSGAGAGSGSGGGGGSSSSGAASGGQAAGSSASGGAQPAESDRSTFIAIELVDPDGKPVAGAAYRVELSDGSTREGQLDAAGKARVDGIPAGTCKISFPDFHASEWEPA